MGETYDSVAGSAQNLFDQTATPMQEMEANTRKLQQALVPLGEKIVELANVVLPPLVAIITAVSEVFGVLPEPVQNFVIILGHCWWHLLPWCRSLRLLQCPSEH